MHLIHPLLRPYVPAIDNILATLHSIVDLLTLIIFLPWEYALHWWHHRHWSLVWNKTVEPSDSGDCSSSDSDLEDNEVGRRQLRPRNRSHQARMKEANRQAQVVFQELDDAQNKVRTRARGQFLSNVRPQPVREAQNLDGNTVGLRTRKRVLDYSSGLPDEAVRIPGSKSTGVHHLHPTTVSQPAQDPSPQLSPAFPNAPNTHPLSRPSSPIRIPTPVSSSHSSHEIWYPPQSVFEGPEHRWTPPDTVRRTPSPIYPPLPSAYQFTPPPRSVTPPDVATFIPRQVSTGAIPQEAFDAYEGIDQFPGRSSQAGPSARVLSADRRTRPGESFREALEPSIQAMDMDTVTLSTRDGSSASEQFMDEDDGNRLRQRNMVEPSTRNTKRTRDGIRESALETRTNRRAPTGPVRRSGRTRNETPSNLETDEFGFAIRPESSTLKRLAINASLVPSLRTDLLALGQSGLKPLARTKPALKATQEEGSPAGSSDEESVKKKRKLKSDVEGQSHPSAENNLRHDLSSAGETQSGKTRRKATVQGTTREIDVSDDVLKSLQVGTRATRASTRQPPVSRQGRGTAIKRGKRK